MVQVEFFFDVGSPYSYLAYYELPKIVTRQKAEIIWRPILLGGIFKATGNSSPVNVPAKRNYSSMDLKRWATRYDIPFHHNPFFPINTLQIMRGAVGVQMHETKLLSRYLDAVFNGMFRTPRNLGDQAEFTSLLQESGIDPDLVMKLAAMEDVKNKLKSETEAAVERGLFGAPSFIVGDELYWGQDRLLFVEEALERAK